MADLSYKHASLKNWGGARRMIDVLAYELSSGPIEDPLLPHLENLRRRRKARP